MAAGDTMQVSVYTERPRSGYKELFKKASRCCKEKKIVETI
jgi:hypothetical protein